ncbi:MAG: hypothetical protein K8S27_02560 [Candidatus Omnitrophica bacterium]|nr:hypothetical protein [Candidatus Omnitrophota bacterium]
MKPIKCIFLFILFIFLTDISQAQLLMEKSRVELDVQPGSTIIDDMFLNNTSDKFVEVRIYWQDFEYVPPFNGKKKFIPPGDFEFSMADWVTFSPQKILIKPRGREKINYVIKIPADARGGYYGVLFFENVPEAAKMSGIGVNLITRLGSLFFLRSNERSKHTVIKDFDLEDGTIKGIIQNQGNVIIFPKGVYYILDQDSMVAKRGELKKIYLPPLKDAEFQLDLPNLDVGQYTLILTFDLDDGDSIVREVDFFKERDATITVTEIRK